MLSIYGLSDKRVVRLCKLLTQNITPSGKRGKNRSANAIPGDVCQKIHDHVSSFPTKQTHYGSNEKHYLDARLNSKIIFDMFLSKHPECKGKVSYYFYIEYFHDNFDLKFGRTQVDVCITYESLKSKL